MAFGRNRVLAAAVKARQSQPPPGSRRVSEDWLLPLPLPEVHEGGESLWDEWHEASDRMELAFAETQPGFGRQSDPALGGPWRLDDVLELARRNNRVCPRPMLWSALYALQKGDLHPDLPPPPVQPWNWKALSNLQRRMRFRDHIEWADRHGKLEELARYVDSVAEADWLHMDES